MPRSRVLLPFLLVLLVFATRPVAAEIDRWTPLGPDGGTITALAADPQIHGTLYAGSQGGAVWKSLDGGARWFSASEGIQTFDISSLAVAPGGSGRVWAGTPGGIYQTENGGLSWQRVWSVPGHPDGALSHWVLCVAADPTDPDVAWAGTWSGVVLRTLDGGATWEDVQTTSGGVFDLAVDPTDPDTVYAARSFALEKTTDGGATWARIHQGDAPRLVLDPSDPRTLYIGGGFRELSKSTDGGITWNRLTGLEGSIYELFLDPTHPSVLLAGTADGRLMRSEDTGATWRKVDGLPYLLAFTFTADSSGRLWLGVDRRGIFRSLDGGATWRGNNRGLAASLIWDVAFDPFRPRTLYSAVHWTGFHRSVNGGATWTRSNAGLPAFAPGITVYDLTADPHLPGVLYAGTEYGIYQSRNRGGQWSRLLLSEGEISSIAIHPRRRGMIFAVGEEVYRSLDGGRTWRRFFLPDRPYEPKHSRVVLDPLRPRSVFVLDYNSRRGTAESLFRSTDGGETWQRVFQEGPTALAISRVNPDLMVLGTDGGEIWKSVDRGSTWNRIAGRIGNGTEITALLIDAATPSTLYLGTDGAGAWRSLDGGITWAPLATGLIAPRITSLEADSRNPRHLLAGTQGGGVLEIRLTTP